MHKLARRGYVDTEEEAQQARRDVFVRGILHPDKSYIPEKLHPDQLLLDQIDALANSGTAHNGALQAAGCRLMKTRGTATLSDVRAEHAELVKLKSGAPQTTLLNQRDAALQSLRVAESALDARRSAELVGPQQCHTSALAALNAAKVKLDTQKSDERVSVDSLFVLRDRCTACQSEVDAAKKALDQLVAAHAWVDTSRAA